MTAYELFERAERELLTKLGIEDVDDGLLKLSNKWQSVDRSLLMMHPAISTALTVLQDDEDDMDDFKTWRSQHFSRSSSSSDSSQRSSSSVSPAIFSSCSDTSDFNDTFMSALSHITGPVSQTSTGSNSTVSSSDLPVMDSAPPIIPPCQVRSTDDLYMVPEVASLEDFLELMKQDNVIAMPSGQGTVLYEIIYLDDLQPKNNQSSSSTTRQTPTNSSKTSPSINTLNNLSLEEQLAMLSPEMLTYLLQDEDVVKLCEQAGLISHINDNLLTRS